MTMRYMTDTVDYPRAADLIDGLSLGTFYDYAGSNLVTWLKYQTDVTHGWILERYDAHDPADVAEVFGSKHWVRANDLDDFVVLGRLHDEPRIYVLLWFDCDTSDSKFMLFETDDHPETVAAEVAAWLDGQCRKELAGQVRTDEHGSGWETLSGVYPITREQAARVTD